VLSLLSNRKVVVLMAPGTRACQPTWEAGIMELLSSGQVRSIYVRYAPDNGAGGPLLRRHFNQGYVVKLAAQRSRYSLYKITKIRGGTNGSN
jgi:hypothetical protein